MQLAPAVNRTHQKGFITSREGAAKQCRTCMTKTLLMTRASFCCTKKIKKLRLFLTKVAKLQLFYKSREVA